MRHLMLGLLLLGGPSPQESSLTEAPVLQSVDDALDHLPPIGREGTYDATKRAWNFDPAVAWLKAHLERGGTLSDEQWRRALLGSGAIRVRERWPIDRPFAVSIEIPAWLPLTEIRLYTDSTAEFEARAGRTIPTMCGNCSAAQRNQWRYQELKTLKLGSQALNLHVVVERGSDRASYLRQRDAPPPDGPLGGVLWRGTLDLQIEGVATFEEALPATHDDALDAAVRKALSVSCGDEEVWVLGDVDRVPELESIAVSFEVELREGTSVRETGSLTVLDRPGFVSQSVLLVLPEQEPDLTRWSVHVRGCASGALRAWNAERYWNGELVFPLADVQKR